VSSRPLIVLAVIALVLRPLGLAAQGTSDSVQGYAPADPAPAPEPTPAQTPAANAAAAIAASGQASALKSLGFLEILTPRSADRIQQEIEQTRLDASEADAEMKRLQGVEDQVKAMVQVKKQEVSTLDAQKKLAEKAKNEAEEASFEAEKKDAERHRQFLEKRVSLHHAEKETAKARKDLAEATRKSLELELQLTKRRGEREAGGSDAAAALRHDNVIRELERKVLDAQRVQADREKQVADRHQDIARRRLELYQAQAAAGGNR
jgi:hypothetical protein